jgi:transcriptional regulator GlxA family with amidase domain
MKTVALLIFNEVVPSSITGVVDLLTGANKYMERAGQPIAFCLEMVSQSLDTLHLAFPNQQIDHKAFQHAGHPDLIIVPSFSVGNMEPVIVQNMAAINWLEEMHTTGSEIASLCVGSYFLAEAGLLDGKEVTSHWAAADDIQKRYPRIKMKSDLVITDQDGILPAAGRSHH